jgi:hypothetical protein
MAVISDYMLRSTQKAGQSSSNIAEQYTSSQSELSQISSSF